MKIGGFLKNSFIDFPGRISSVIFTIGCNFRCYYCHNKNLVYPENYPEEITAEKIVKYLEKRIGKIDGVCITGGEPLIHKDIADFITMIKSMGLDVKVDTNGSFPDVLESIIKFQDIDYIAMDVKAPIWKYRVITGVDVDMSQLIRSVEIIKKSGIDYEFRTTLVDEIMDERSLAGIGEVINGAKKFFLQKRLNFDGLLSKKFSPGELIKFFSNFVEKCEIR